MDKLVVEMDPDVKAVCDFMGSNIDPAKLVIVARAVAELAPVMWQHFPNVGFYDPPLSVRRITDYSMGNPSQSPLPQAAT
ncbi:hypothetical protein KTQ54_16060 [Komagataeibacter oboediens]|uniref:hypothetical protein n=1 Tax=Komagataeibacter oboediens TaxID=65958 RepID=UPI001C2B96B1|nr:hypothetical protein [Komagataeibacter oboediens]MBV0890016.1 hypothetical protein [Komagataeibacter oboediens]MCK9818606.1 hypothetical protein [Komagataeibacter oboediens]